MEVKNKYYGKLPDGKWKVYIQLFTKKGTKQRLYLKPGITEFWDGDARMYFNNLTEEDSFIKHFDTKVMWSKIFPSKAEAEKVEKELQRLEGVGGIEAIVPAEGIVFKYNGKLFKLTGAFAAINQLMGIIKYGR